MEKPHHNAGKLYELRKLSFITFRSKTECFRMKYAKSQIIQYKNSPNHYYGDGFVIAGEILLL